MLTVDAADLSVHTSTCHTWNFTTSHTSVLHCDHPRSITGDDVCHFYSLLEHAVTVPRMAFKRGALCGKRMFVCLSLMSVASSYRIRVLWHQILYSNTDRAHLNGTL